MTPEVILFTFLIAFIVGTIASLLGLGGGTLNVPVLVLIFSFDQITAIALSLTIGVALSFTSMVNYAWQQRILYRTALLLAVPAIIFSIVSVLLSTFMPDTILTIIFIILLLTIAMTMIKPKFISLPEIVAGPKYHDSCIDRYGEEYSRDYHVFHMLLWGGGGGMMNGFTGLGGGSVNVPALIAAKTPAHYATATSTMAVFFASIAAAATHSELGNIQSTGFLAIYIVGVVCGAIAGTRYARKVKSSQLSFGFGLFLVFVCFLMALKLVL
jgi:uncharacterized protein